MNGKTVNLVEGLHKKLKAHCAAKGMKMSWALALAVSDWLRKESK